MSAKITGCVPGMLLSLPLTFLTAAFEGVVLVALWSRFIVPFGLPALTVAKAVGLSLTVGLITHQYIPTPDDDNDMIVLVIQRTGVSFVRTSTYWLCGIVAYWFVR